MGVAKALAERRASMISNLSYHLAFTIPHSISQPVTGRARVTFRLEKTDLLDRLGGLDRLDGWDACGGHFLSDPSNLSNPSNLSDRVLDFTFTSADAPLNRRDGFMYTLFVPAHAHLAFPCFDQPDLKARFTLTLTLPSDWKSVSNGEELGRTDEGDAVTVRYAETAPIPTYLFAFAAGSFEIETTERDGRVFRMFHCETDATKVARNRDAVFDLVAASLAWLEDYTGIAQPFPKYDLVLIPSFQFSGMEHPGAIYFNQAAILLDDSATQDQLLRRATLIAHETAHLWFGDLVTMKWFDDVWLKEVFASFLAAKIVNPSFPAVNHDLQFLVSNYPAAYSVERTSGTHPIRQPLGDLDHAGSLYGPIIYNKAPIVMRQLERLVGADVLRDALHEYLNRFRFGTATWPDLVGMLDQRTPADVAAWSRTWIEGAARLSIEDAMDVEAGDLANPVARGASWIGLWEEMLDGRMKPPEFLDAVFHSLPLETDEQIVHLVLGYIRSAFWLFLTPAARLDTAPRLEHLARHGLQAAVAPSLKSTWFAAFRSTALSPDAMSFVERVWRRQEPLPGLVLGEQDEAATALELAVREISDVSGILAEQMARFRNPDRKAQFAFVMPSVSPVSDVRNACFGSLADVASRHREPWVLEALGWLNHPLRRPQSERYILPVLELLEEIERTGDIFFPKRWLDATLGGHNSKAAAAIVRGFLSERPHYPIRLKRIILQAADLLFRPQVIGESEDERTQELGN